MADPAAAAGRCLDRMGLPMAEAVVHPERNRRAVLTLSHAQVRQPINSRGVGRWRNYAWPFDDGWNNLAERTRRAGGGRGGGRRLGPMQNAARPMARLFIGA